jgi:putative hydrolase
MIDLHTHTFFSDGVLSVSELVYRAKTVGYTHIAITDHVDEANIEFVVKNIQNAVKNLSTFYNITVLPGVELTYVPPEIIPKMVVKARNYGAKIVVVHGESPVEPVPPGTNMAAVLSRVDVLAHPGNVTKDVAEIAHKNNVAFEITSRKGHSNTNAWVAEISKKENVNLVFNNDVHFPENILNKEQIYSVLSESKLDINEYSKMLKNAENIINRNIKI